MKNEKLKTKRKNERKEERKEGEQSITGKGQKRRRDEINPILNGGGGVFLP